MTRFVWLVDIGVLEMIGKGNFKKKLSFLQSQGNPLMIEAYSTHQRQWNHTRPLIDASTSCTYISLSEIRCLALDSALA